MSITKPTLYEKFYLWKHERTKVTYGLAIRNFIKNYLSGEFPTEKMSIDICCQIGKENIRPLLVTIFVKGDFKPRICTCVDSYDRGQLYVL